MPVTNYARKVLLLIAAMAAVPVGAGAAGPVRGLTFERAVFTDSAEVALRAPEGVACDDKGAVVVADTGNARLLTYTWKDGSLDGGKPLRLPQLTHPVRLQIDSKGYVLVLDRRSRKIVRVDASGAYAGFLEPKGASWGAVTVAAFKLDASDNAYVLDVVARRVAVASKDGSVTRELPLPPAKAITDIAVEPSGKIFAVDAVTATVYAAEPAEKEFRAVSPSLKDRISFPGYLAADGRGRLFVVDQNGSAVVRLGTDGTFQGRDLAWGAVEGALNYPGQLCITPVGDVLVADRNNDRVQIFSLPR
jgi:sugar lactone lactonase YvrE